MSSFSGYSIIFPGFLQVRIYFFYMWGHNIWSSTHTLGPILIRNTPKCSKLNCRQFEYIFIKIYSTLSRNFFKTSTVKQIFFQKMIERKMPLFSYHSRELKG